MADLYLVIGQNKACLVKAWSREGAISKAQKAGMESILRAVPTPQNWEPHRAWEIGKVYSQ